MAKQEIPSELMKQLARDREAIAQELPELAERNTKMKEAAGESTVSAHLRRAIHQSRRPLADIATDAGINVDALCGFLEGERNLRSDVVDRLAQAVRVIISLTTAS